jgi:hypothetical protein
MIATLAIVGKNKRFHTFMSFADMLMSALRKHAGRKEPSGSTAPTAKCHWFHFSETEFPQQSDCR